MENDILIGGQQKRNWVKWVAIGVGCAVLIAIISVVIVKLLPKDADKISIVSNENLGMSGEKIDEFRTFLIRLLREQGYVGENDSVEDVVVRDGTVSSFTEKVSSGNVMGVTSFLVDIDSIKQTFRVKVSDYTGSMTDIPVTISCPNASETKYPESECRGEYGSTSKSLRNHLPLVLKNGAGERILVKKIEPASDGTQLVQVYLYSCNDENPQVDEATQLVKNKVTELDDPSREYYSYNIRTGYCEGDAV